MLAPEQHKDEQRARQRDGLRAPHDGQPPWPRRAGVATRKRAPRSHRAGRGERQVGAHGHQRPVREVDAPVARVVQRHQGCAAKQHSVHEERKHNAHLQCRASKRSTCASKRSAVHACMRRMRRRTASQASLLRSNEDAANHSRQSCPAGTRQPVRSSAPMAAQQRGAAAQQQASACGLAMSPQRGLRRALHAGCAAKHARSGATAGTRPQLPQQAATGAQCAAP